MDVIVSDFDGTLFKRNHGLIVPTVRYLEQMGYPIYILTYRAEDQLRFVAQTLALTGLDVVGYAFANSRKKDPFTKIELAKRILEKHNIIEALDNDEDAVVSLRSIGINAKQVGT